jgi:methyl-accepting chemotaxis protein
MAEDKQSTKPKKKAAAKKQATEINYATREEVLELINSLNQGLRLRDETNKLLQEQIETNQRILHRRGKITTYIIILLGVSILTLGYSAGGIIYNMDRAMKIVSNNMDEMRDFMATMSTEMTAMADQIDKMENGIQKMSGEVATIDDSVRQMSIDVNHMSRNVAGMSYDTHRMQNNMDDMMPWK